MSEEEKVIEVKFDSEKEKVFIFLKSNVTINTYEKLFELLTKQNESKIYLLPSDYIESVTVVKDMAK